MEQFNKEWLAPVIFFFKFWFGCLIGQVGRIMIPNTGCVALCLLDRQIDNYSLSYGTQQLHKMISKMITRKSIITCFNAPSSIEIHFIFNF